MAERCYVVYRYLSRRYECNRKNPISTPNCRGEARQSLFFTNASFRKSPAPLPFTPSPIESLISLLSPHLPLFSPAVGMSSPLSTSSAHAHRFIFVVLPLVAASCVMSPCPSLWICSIHAHLVVLSDDTYSGILDQPNGVCVVHVVEN